MKILVVHNHYQEYGGEETYFRSLLRLLKSQKHQVITYEKDSRHIVSFTDRLQAAIGMFWNPRMEKELGRILREHRPDVVQFQNVYPLISPAAYRVCRRHSIPVIQRISSYRLVCPKGWLFRNSRVCETCVAKKFPYPAVVYGCYHESRAASLVFSLAMFFHRFIAGSFDNIDTYLFPAKFVRDYFVSHGIVPSGKAVVIPTCDNPVRPEASAVKTGGRYFVYAGRLSPEKGIVNLLDIFSQSPKIKLIVIGSDRGGALEKKYAGATNILFTGFLEKPAILAYMRQAAATVMPSLWYDILPNVLIESYSVGTPVIAPRLGVFTDLVKQKVTGFLYHDTAGLRRALVRFRKTDKMRASVIEEYRRAYLPVRHHTRLQQVYRSLTGLNRASAG